MFRWRVLILAVLAVQVFFPWGSAQTLPANNSKTPFVLVREAGGIREYRLAANGLTVLMMEDHSVPVATAMITYRIGSAGEPGGGRGAVHLIEHMMFKGTPRFNKESGTAIAQTLQQTGAQMNAMTGPDATSYYEILPSDNLDLALTIEADRMRNSLMRPGDFASEKDVVLNELERHEDAPFTALYQAVWKEAFQIHPYRHPVIGYREDIGKMDAGRLREFYGRLYRPDNAVLTVIGDFQTDRVLGLIAEKFGAIQCPAAGPVPPLPAEPPQLETRRISVTRDDDIQFVMIAHKTPAALHPDTAALDVLAQVLSGGKTSLLYQRLVEPGWAASVEVSPSKMRDPGLFLGIATLAPGSSHRDVEALILQAYEDVRTQGVTAADLQKAKNQLRARVAFARDGSYSIASQLNDAIAAGDWRSYADYPEQIRAVTAGDVQRVARQYLVPAGMTAGYFISNAARLRAAPARPALDPNAVQKNPGAVTGEKFAPEMFARPAEPSTEISRSQAAAGFYQSIRKRIRTKRIRGIKVMTLKTGVTDIVTLTGSFDGAGTAYGENPVLARLVGQMLDKRTRGRSKFEIAGLLENRGAEVSYEVGPERVRFHAQCLAEDLMPVMELIGEQLRAPEFDPQDFENVKKREEVRLRNAASDAFSQGLAALSRLVYPKGHPYFELPYDEQLQLLGRTSAVDAEEFYRRHYGPRDMAIVAVGGPNPEALEGAVRRGFERWKKPSVKKSFPRKALANSLQVMKRIEIPGKTNLDVFFGHGLELYRNDKDFLPLYLANFILGGDFSARLSDEVRDRQGLTYSVHSALSGVTPSIQGEWIVHMMINPPLLDRGIQAVLEQLRLFSEKGITAEELARKKSTVRGTFKVSLATTGGFAAQILNNEELKRGPDYLDKYPALVDSVRLEDVNAAITAYFHPDKAHVVVSGPAASEAPAEPGRAAAEKQ